MKDDVPQDEYDDIDISQYLGVVNLANVPNPIPKEFSYFVCVPEDEVLYFHSGHHTFDAADETALLLDNAAVIQINLKGIIDVGDETDA